MTNVVPMKKAKRKPRKSDDLWREEVKLMAAAGAVEDEIASKLGIDKNQLRAKFIGDIKAGRRVRAAADEADDSIKKDGTAIKAAIWSSFESQWFSPKHGNDLWPGTDGRNARTPEDAWLRIQHQYEK
jgi:hypothetical protein